MAEQFERGESSVAFSNGAVEALYSALLILGERDEAPKTTEACAALDLLRQKLEHGFAGGRALRLEPPEDELADPARLGLLADLVASLARELSKVDPDPKLGISSPDDRQHRAHWLSKLIGGLDDRAHWAHWLSMLLELHALLIAGLPEEQRRASLLLDLDDEDAAAVEAERLISDTPRVYRRNDVREKIAHLDRIFAALEAAKAIRRRSESVFRMLCDKADLLVKCGELRQAAVEFRRATRYAGVDSQLVRDILEYADALESECASIS